MGELKRVKLQGFPLLTEEQKREEKEKSEERKKEDERAYFRNYYQIHSTNIKRKARESEAKKEYMRGYYADNKARELARTKKWREDNKERFAALQLRIQRMKRWVEKMLNAVTYL